ncbi:acyl-CoA carboxylase epsilon subunit [Amycolatopsis mediterranei]|uniref:acyl-CoA carboxylase epsilon subunit n=1 Tax=Amycolatopsis mediterranei TaxID=33910 RepID=UPI00040DB0F5|nr:acyl-CoA carboxylase epsilon subunit [Amycolatopsis mediterranei]UZF73573.1 acyl-CoA carboxylase subunit epsilon [Amycolatopsis mediterranei]
MTEDDATRIVVRGHPQDAELAALLVALAAVTRGRGSQPVTPLSPWADPSRSHAGPPRRGPGAWRLSGLPR